MKKKYYVDIGNDVLGLFVNTDEEVEIVPTGIMISSMSISDKNEEYKYIEDNYQVSFLFDDYIPEISFYTVPFVEIFAFNEDGFFVCNNDKIYYINNGECWIVASHLNEFKDNIRLWKDNLSLSKDIIIYSSKEDAMKELEFIR